jgi:hypothetical protein
MNVTAAGTPPAALPAPLQIQRPASAQSADEGARESAQHGLPPKRRERETIELPELKPVTVQEFQVMLGALPPSALHRRARAGTGTGTGGSLDVYA